MRVSVKVCAFVFVLFLGGTAAGQQKPADDAKPAAKTSLGDIARQLRTEKAKAPKPVLFVTNDNIGELTESSAVSIARPTQGPSEPAALPSKDSVQGHDEAYFRGRLKELQAQLDTHKRELSVLQQKLGQNQVQYYPNPQDSLMQQYTRGDIDKETAEIDAKKEQVAGDEKAIDDLRDQLRREGGDPGWLR